MLDWAKEVADNKDLWLLTVVCAKSGLRYLFLEVEADPNVLSGEALVIGAAESHVIGEYCEAGPDLAEDKFAAEARTSPVTLELDDVETICWYWRVSGGPPTYPEGSPLAEGEGAAH